MEKSNQRLTVNKVFKLNFLKKIWKNIKKNLIDSLVRDPLDYLAYEANLEQNLKTLCYKILSNQYNPSSQTLIRSAKKDGLTRPLAFLEIEDQIVLNAICESLEPQLLKDFPEYVNYSRSRIKVIKDSSEIDYESWFDRWLRHQDLLKKFVAEDSEYEFVVEADISNFFPSVNLRLLRQAISAKTEAEEKLLQLLFYLLHAMVNKPEYSIDHDNGLPQENHDASRMLAHFFLEPIDKDFEDWGREERYIRWMDDFRIAVTSEIEGRKCLQKLQLLLEKRGLFLNTAKSKILSREQAKSELFLDENAYLEEVHEKTKKGEIIDISEFESKLVAFLEKEKMGGWEKVLRRYYTEARRVRSSILERYAIQHLKEFPSSARYILKYLHGRSHTKELLNQIFDYLKSEENIYEDVEILIYELLLRWRIKYENRSEVVNPALDHFFGRNGWRKPLNEYCKGLIALLVYKYGDYDAVKEIANYFKGSSEKHFVRYSYIILSATNDFKEIAERKVISSEDIGLRRLAGFIYLIRKEPDKYYRLLKNYMNPRKKKFPHMYELEPRALPLFRITKKNQQFRTTKWKNLIESTIRLLENNRDNLKDYVCIKFLIQEKDTP